MNMANDEMQHVGVHKLTPTYVLLRHRQTKGAETDRLIPSGEWKPVLYATL